VPAVQCLGEAGLHPSNIHDNEYAIGSVNFTGGEFQNSFLSGFSLGTHPESDVSQTSNNEQDLGQTRSLFIITVDSLTTDHG
jgi:hypothetical protein